MAVNTRHPGHRGGPDEEGDGRRRRGAARGRRSRARMILQVHDELVFDAPARETRAPRRPWCASAWSRSTRSRVPLRGRDRRRARTGARPTARRFPAGTKRIGPPSAVERARIHGASREMNRSAPGHTALPAAGAPAAPAGPGDDECVRRARGGRPRGVPLPRGALPGARLPPGAAHPAQRGGRARRGAGGLREGVHLARPLRGALELLHLALPARHQSVHRHAAPRARRAPRRLARGRSRSRRPRSSLAPEAEGSLPELARRRAGAQGAARAAGARRSTRCPRPRARRCCCARSTVSPTRRSPRRRASRAAP